MSLLATTTLAALLVANPANTDADRIAANGGFLLGNALRCKVEEQRVVKAGQLVHDLIVAAAGDNKEAEDATMRYAAFFVVSAYPDQAKEKTLASCRMVESELHSLEAHKLPQPSLAAEEPPAVGNGDAPKFRLSDGE